MKTNFFKKHSQQGFTLIELLVVIAIIGILTTIALVSFNSARDRARATSAKGSLSSIRTQAEFYFDSNNTYGTGTDSVCQDADVIRLIEAAIEQGADISCVAQGNTYTVSGPLSDADSPETYCVDSNGYAGALGANFSSGVTCD